MSYAVLIGLRPTENLSNTGMNSMTAAGGYTESVLCEVIEGGVTVASQSMTATGSYAFTYTAGATTASIKYTYSLTPLPGPPPPPPAGPFQFAIDNALLYSLDTSVTGETVCVGKKGYAYGFNGMEKVDEVAGEGNDYDFGARMYDARLGKWFSLDAFDDVYVSFSPYCSFLNNPVWFIDINGDDVWIAYFGTKMVPVDDPNNTGITEVPEEYEIAKVKYKNGKFYNEGGTEIKLKDIKDKKARKYIRRVARDYKKIHKAGQTDAKVNCELTDLNSNGNTLIRNWDGKGKNYSNDKKTPGYNSTVFYNPRSKNDGNGNKRPAFIGLAHELHHAYLFLNNDKSRKGDHSSGIQLEEIDAVLFENRVRVFYDLPIRSKYGGKLLPYLEILTSKNPIKPIKDEK